MSWEAAVTDELNLSRILQDHATDLAQLENRARRRNGEAYSSAMWTRGFRQAVPAVIGWVWHLQMRVNELTDVEYLEELRKGAASLYWPVIGADPTFPADCPTCGFQRLFGVDGLCTECGTELM
jgi:hypothetical protein